MSVRELLHLFFDASSVVYNYNLQDRIETFKRYLVIQTITSKSYAL